MAFDPTSQVTVGGALLAVIFMLLKFKPWERKNSNGKPLVLNTQPPRIATAGEQSADYWQARFDSIEDELKRVREALERLERR